MSKNEYIPYLSEIKEVIPHTKIEYTFRMAYEGDVKPGQFFEVSLPKFGEAPISVSGIHKDSVDLTVRKVGKVTDEIFEHYEGDKLFLRGPYGNGFTVEDYKGKELVIIAGGTGLSPVRGVMEYFHNHIDEVKSLTLVVGFKTADDMLFRNDLKRWAKNSNVIVTVDQAKEGVDLPVGLVTEYIPGLQINDFDNAAAIAVGPPVMMKFATQALLKKGFAERNMWISHERKMCCGIGKCGHCKVDDTYICLDGPVFNFTKGITLVD